MDEYPLHRSLDMIRLLTKANFPTALHGCLIDFPNLSFPAISFPHQFDPDSAHADAILLPDRYWLGLLLLNLYLAVWVFNMFVSRVYA